MTKRKLFLIIADVVLLAVCILQCALNSRDSAKIFEFDDTPDAITIVGEKGTVNLVCENEQWFIGDKKYLAADSYVDSIIESVSYIRVLDKVGTANSEAEINRYELNDGKKIAIEAYKNGKLLRSLQIGKDATASSQGYITVDGKNDIYLASGNLRLTFNKSVDELRSHVVWQLDKEEINSVEITPADGNTWAISKMGSGDDVAWNTSGVVIDVDGAKANEWFSAVAAISTPVWHDEGENLGGEKIISAKIGVGFKTVTIDIYEIPAANEEEKTVFWATSSESPYTFELAQYAVQKFQKNADELSK